MTDGRAAGTWVLVLTWNGWEATRACLESLRRVRGRGARILVVDNGSTDGTPAHVRREFPDVELLENGTNLGFAAGNNVGIRAALAGGAEHVVLLNNDTVVAPDCVEELVTAACAHPHAGMVSAKILLLDEPDVLWFAGGSLSTLTGRATHKGYRRRDNGRYEQVREIGRPCACAMLVTRRFLDTVGLMEESLFLYGEEVDWALRARACGFACLFAPRARVWHKVTAASGGEAAARYYYYAVRNMLWTLERRDPVRWRWLSALRSVIVVMTFAGSTLRVPVERRAALGHVLAGACDYWRGITGPRPDASGRP